METNKTTTATENAMTATQTPAIRLQGIGFVTAKPAGEIAIGDVLVWNYGYRSRVEAVRVVSPAFVVADLLSDHDGKVYPRRMKRDRLVAFSRRPW